MLDCTESEARELAAASPLIGLPAEFLKGATNAVAAWWSRNPRVDREVIIDEMTHFTWSGFQARANVDAAFIRRRLEGER
jgi:hypothetical protein